MMYSSGIFPSEESSMEAASLNKMTRICEKLLLKSDDHLLEIGTGWGSLAIFAAQRYGCRVTTTTISQQQFELAQQRIEAAGLAHRITVLLQDYRSLTGQYDKLVSVEMIEAVGHDYYPAFYRQCAQLLKPDGLMLIQAITIADARYDQARRSVDFIKRYIFPGCCIPSVTALQQAMSHSSDLRLVHLEDITEHYARTLNHWHQSLMTNIDQVRAQGYSETFIRMWVFYLCYCEGGFAERSIGDVQMVYAKPLNRTDTRLQQVAAGQSSTQRESRS
jgi:cyclopropane-fatty-acyl-phospholipid synthase